MHVDLPTKIVEHVWKLVVYKLKRGGRDYISELVDTLNNINSN